MVSRFVLPSVLALLLLVLVPTASADHGIDEQHSGGTVWTGSRGFWQSVETEATQITKVELYMQAPCSGAAPVRLKVTTSTDPNSGVLADVDGYGLTGPVGSAGWQTFDFPDFYLAPYTTIYLHMLETQMLGPWCSGGNSWWSYSNSGGYPFGQASWSSSVDINFRVYGGYYEQSLSSGGTSSLPLTQTGDARHFRISVPSGQSELKVEQWASGGTNDFDLYVKYGSRPTLSTYDCRPYTGSSTETCTIANPAAGTWYIMSRSFSGSGTTNVKATYKANAAPYTPSLVSPSNGATNVGWTPTLDWSSSGDPDGNAVTYTVHGWRGVPFVTQQLCTATHPTTACTSGVTLDRGVNYQWWVVASDGALTATSSTWSFTTAANTAPNAPTNPSPTDGATGRPTSLTLSWTNNGDPNGDTVTNRVYFGTSSNPTTLQCGPSTSMSSCSVSGLSYNTRYYWKVEATDGHGGTTTRTWSFWTNRDPYTPTLASPGNGATGVSWTPTLDWTSSGDPDGDAVTYTAWGWPGVPFTTQFLCSATHATTQCTSSTLQRGRTYDWWVEASDGTRTATSATWSFTTAANTAPNAPTSPNPTDGATGRPTSLTLSWTNNGDPDGDTVTNRVYFGTSSNPTTLQCGPSTSMNTCPVSGLARNTRYYWKVEATDGHGGTTTRTWSFWTNQNPYTPSLVAPSNGATSVAWTPTLDWTSSGDPDGDAVTYTAWGWPGAPFTNQVLCSATHATTQCAPSSALMRGRTYSWWVEASDGVGTATSPTWSFTTRPNTNPNADFTSTSTGLTVNFVQQSSDADNDPLTYFWEFGDGATSTAASPSHTYGCLSDAASGQWTVRLTATDNHGGSHTRTRNVAVSDADNDGDGLAACREAVQGTQDGTPATTQDFDLDGLNDFVESRWNTNRDTLFCGTAACDDDKRPDPLVQDIYIEMDYMGADHLPTSASLDEIVAVYTARGIRMHLDAGNARTAAYNLGGGNTMAHDDHVGATCGDWTEFDTVRNTNMTAGRREAFHYMIWAHEQAADCNGSSGRSHGIPGRDFIVTLGRFGGHGTEDQMVGTFIHELGHNLGLFHGGDENRNHKPNYLSVMNYLFQLDGIPRTGGAGNLFDYSADAIGELNEAHLDERDGLGHASAAGFRTMWRCPNGSAATAPAAGSNGPLDWDCDGNATEADVRSDINNHNAARDPQCGSAGNATCERYDGHDDWDALDLRGIVPGHAPGAEVPLTPPIDLPIGLGGTDGTMSETDYYRLYGYPDMTPEEYEPIREAWESME